MFWIVFSQGDEETAPARAGGDTREQASANARLISSAPDLLAACEAAMKYDDALRSCANDPNRMSSFCTVEGDDLDALYADWRDKARAAVAKAGA